MFLIKGHYNEKVNFFTDGFVCIVEMYALIAKHANHIFFECYFCINVIV